MKFLIATVTTLLIVLTIIKASSASSKPQNIDSDKNIYGLSINSIDGKKIDFNNFKNKKILIVNTASKCGFTNQFENLQNISNRYNDKVVVIGVPSNDFLGQEPLENNEITDFCQENYGVTFLMTEKVHVKGSKAHDLFNFLSKKELNGWNDSWPSWNFNKYLIDENGLLVEHFGSMVNPESTKITNYFQ